MKGLLEQANFGTLQKKKKKKGTKIILLLLDNLMYRDINNNF
jgi:hypothetical protein